MEIASARNQLFEKVKQVSQAGFETLALDIFRYQATNNPLYARYLELLGVAPSAVRRLGAIPFLPIQFFKRYPIKTGSWREEAVFRSSGTTAATTSRHYVRFLNDYVDNTQRGFQHFYGDPQQYCLLALLPSYLERSDSSLVSMARHFIERSRYPQSDFFLYNTEGLLRIIGACQKKDIPVFLLGVSFALLDLAEQGPFDFRGVTVMETGGMKGRRREMTRTELHGLLKEAFRVEHIHSEYGMTELFSQAYSQKAGRFLPSPTMRVLTREITDPFTFQDWGRTGAINIVDLANLDTISFIATDDLGKVHPSGDFEILGRLDASDVRGCNLLLQESI